MTRSNTFARLATYLSIWMLPAVPGSVPRGINAVTSSSAKASTCSTTANDARAAFLYAPCSQTLDKSHSVGFSPQMIQKARRLVFFQAVILSFSHNLPDMLPRAKAAPLCCPWSPFGSSASWSDAIQHISKVPEHVLNFFEPPPVLGHTGIA